MDNSLFLGLDIGTTHVKAAAYRSDGAARAEALRAYPTYYPQAGWAEQSPGDWQQAVAACLKELLLKLGGDADHIEALGLSSHAPTLIPVNSAGVPLLERVPIWQDERAVAQARRLLKEIGPDWVGLGMPFASFAAKLRWFAEAHPALASDTAYVLGIKTYLAQWLTGHRATDPSSEPGNAPEWQAMCRACGWSLDRLPPVISSSAVVGELGDGLVEELGFKRCIPVVIGLNDGGSAVLGNGAFQAGEGVLTLSTNGVAFLVAEEPVAASERLQRAVFCWPYLDGRWVIGGQTKSGAASLQWLYKVLYTGAAGGDEIDMVLADCATSPPGSRGVMFFPYLMGQGTPRDNPAARGAFTGLMMSTDRADLARSVLEGVAFSLREVLEELDRHIPSVGRLNITGGGAQSKLWRQIVADVLNRPLGYSHTDSCLGAAMLAAVGAGEYLDAGAACGGMMRAPEETTPQSDAVDAYQHLYAEFCQHRDAHLAFYWT